MCFQVVQHIQCTCAGTRGGNAVEVEGSFDNWTSRQRMQKSGKDYTIVKLLPPGVYQARNNLHLAMWGAQIITAVYVGERSMPVRNSQHNGLGRVLPALVLQGEAQCRRLVFHTAVLHCFA